MKNTFFLIFVTLFFITVSHAQENEQIIEQKYDLKKRKIIIDNIKKIDFLAKKYKFINSDFSISIDSTNFNNLKRDFKVINNNLTYRDSLRLILEYELDNFHARRIALRRITYNWKRMSYYIWETEEKTKELGNNLGFEHPYRFYEFLFNEKINTDFKNKFVKNLKKRAEKRLNKEIKVRSYSNFFNRLLKESPQRKRDMEVYFKKKGIKNHKH
jgi:hypothetical protein